MNNALNNQVGMLGDMFLWLGAGIINEHKCILSRTSVLAYDSATEFFDHLQRCQGKKFMAGMTFVV